MAYGNSTRWMGGMHGQKLWLTGQLRVRAMQAESGCEGSTGREGRECEDRVRRVCRSGRGQARVRTVTMEGSNKGSGAREQGCTDKRL